MTTRIVRPGGPGDLSALLELADLAGPGFTSLQPGRKALDARLQKSEVSFAADTTEQEDQVFCLMLEDAESGAVAGTSAVKSQIGLAQPYVNFRVTTAAQFSEVVDRRFDMHILFLVTECAGSSEVGTLFLRKEARGGGMGSLISLSRYMLIAAAPQRFGDHIVSELRGHIDEDGVSPFWEAVGRRFFDMDFKEADKLSAQLGNQFLWDLLPKHPIYVDLLPEEAQAVVGKVHPEGVGAQRLLESQGFRYRGLIDVFDAGPLVSTRRDELRCLRESKRMTVRVEALGEGAGRAMISNDRVADFRCALGRAAVKDGEAVIDEDAARGLDLASGENARIWML